MVGGVGGIGSFQGAHEVKCKGASPKSPSPPAVPPKRLPYRCSTQEFESFQRDRNSFGKAHPELSNEDATSLLLNAAILRNQKELVRELLGSSTELTVLTSIDAIDSSPISRCFQVGDVEIFSNIEQYIIRWQTSAKTSHLLNEDLGMIMSLLEFPMNKAFTPLKCAPPLRGLEPCDQVLGLMGVIVDPDVATQPAKPLKKLPKQQTSTFKPNVTFELEARWSPVVPKVKKADAVSVHVHTWAQEPEKKQEKTGWDSLPHALEGLRVDDMRGSRGRRGRRPQSVF